MIVLSLKSLTWCFPAINRIHRIGQLRKTFVWRYIIDDTIETKIDAIRINQSAAENTVVCGERSGNGHGAINAGGIDGYFSTEAEILTLLRI